MEEDRYCEGKHVKTSGPTTGPAESDPLDVDNLSVAPRAFQLDDLPSTPELNSIMDRAMKKVKHLLKELETDKGSIKPLPKKATRNVTMAALLIEEVTRSLAKE